jgi:biopolymer transport protein TolR
MGASLNTGSAGGGSRRRGRGRGRKAPMSEINVTPMVDVMLVLLIIFMVAAPLLTVGVPVELPSARGGSQLEANKEPLSISIKDDGQVYIGEALVPMDELVAKLKAISQTRKGDDEPVFVRGHKGANYGMVMKVFGRIREGGFKKASLVIEVEDKG